MVLGILLLPMGVILLIWNESKAIQHAPIFQAYQSEPVYWGFRLVGLMVLLYCFQQIFSFIKLFMMKIPLSYNEIRAGIWITACILSIAVFLIIISVCWIYAKPMVSLILVIVTAVFILGLLIRQRQKKKIENSQMQSVQPRQAKNT